MEEEEEERENTCCRSRILIARSVEENIFTMTGMIFCWYSSADRNFPTWQTNSKTWSQSSNTLHSKQKHLFTESLQVDRIDLEERREDDGSRVAKLEGGEQLRQDFMFTEVFRERVQIIIQVLEKLLLLSRILDLPQNKNTDDNITNKAVLITTWINKRAEAKQCLTLEHTGRLTNS